MNAFVCLAAGILRWSGQVDSPGEAMGVGPFGLNIDGIEWRERIGRGGFSVVYRARQTRLDRDVAIKVLTTDLSDPADMRRFETECRLMGRLSAHRHIVDVHDAAIGSGGQPYIVMKYYTGGTLATAVASNGPMTTRTVVDIGTKLADALATAHAAGVIHRDIKAENVLLDEHGEPVMTDFGVAAVADPDGRFTSSIAFSRAYVAPEVLDRNEYGTASDVYSLGATLYTLLTGRPVFEATTEARTVIAVLEGTPTPVGRPDVPAELEALVLACLAKQPHDRPASAALLRDALRRIDVNGESVRGLGTTAHSPSGADSGVPTVVESPTPTTASPALGLFVPPKTHAAVAEAVIATRLVSPDHRHNDPPLAPMAARGHSVESAATSTTATRDLTAPTPGDGGDPLRTVRRSAVSSTTPRIGTVTTIAGGKQGHSNGVGTAARFSFPADIALTTDGVVIVADSGSNRIRCIEPDGTVFALAGWARGNADGAGTAARLHFPSAVAVASDGSVVVADSLNDRIRRITPDGTVTTLAGSTPGYADGSRSAAQFHLPSDVAVAADGSIIVADTLNHRIRRITPDGTVTTLAGSTRGYTDGAGTDAQFDRPSGVVAMPDGSIIVADSYNDRIRRLAPDGMVTTLAGSTPGYTDGAGTETRFHRPGRMSTAPDGAIVVADTYNDRIRLIAPHGTVSTLAGSKRGYADGPADAAHFHFPSGVAVQPDGTVLVADTHNHRIRRITDPH